MQGRPGGRPQTGGSAPRAFQCNLLEVETGRFLIVAAVGLSPIWAQNPIQQTYAKLCGGCHGADARGTEQGPGLAGNVSVRRRSVQSLRNVIRNGIPAAGMPGFDLPAARSMLSQRWSPR